MSLTRQILFLLACATYSRSALAHGDMSVLLVPIVQVAFLLAPFIVFHRSRNGHRVNVVGTMFLSMLIVHAVTARVPYVNNKSWLLPLLLLTPPIAWLAVELVRLFKQRRDHTSTET